MSAAAGRDAIAAAAPMLARSTFRRLGSLEMLTGYNPAAGQKEKQVFFEKKNQKTFAS